LPRLSIEDQVSSDLPLGAGRLRTFPSSSAASRIPGGRGLIF
jgi:hypothetical protein